MAKLSYTFPKFFGTFARRTGLDKVVKIVLRDLTREIEKLHKEIARVVNANDELVSTNTTDITNNADAISDNTDDITTNADDISDLQGDSSWTTPTLLNSWVNFGVGHAEVEYRKTGNNEITIRGLAKDGTLNTALFILPLGYRPLAKHVYAVISNDAIGRVDITVTGDVIIGNLASSAFVSISGITFRTD